MDNIKDGTFILSKQGCIYCERLKEYLDVFHKEYVSFDITDIPKNKLDEILKKNDIKTYPAVFIDGRYIGGYTEYMNNLLEKA